MQTNLMRVLAVGLLCGCAATPQAPPPEHPGATWRERLERASRTPEAWRARSAEIRTQILVSAGLWPEIERSPVRVETSGRLERDGYTVERIRLETWPGFFLAGNLYLPRGKSGPFPAVASPHGHWKLGRFNHSKDASQPGRALTLARLGFVVLNYDMVGYSDTTQVPHKFADEPWGVNLMGLQLWNSLCVVDYLSSRPDVDPDRIAATGASGGGTQTFLLAAVEPRIKASVPVNMVAAGCQGGCTCENAPLLRIDLNNIEIAAAIAPRALLLMACTGDWTADVPTLEGPAVKKVYDALGAVGKFRWAQVDANHNYNQDTREIVYAFLAQHLQGEPVRERIPEPAFEPETRENLELGAPSEKPDLAALMRKRYRAGLEAIWPDDDSGHTGFRVAMEPAFRYMLGVRWPTAADLEIRREGDTMRVRYRFLPGEVTLRKDGDGVSVGEWTIAFPASYEREEPCNAGVEIRRKNWVQWRENLPLTYYRTRLARQVQDVLTALAAVGGPEVRLVARGDAAVPVLLARALVPEGRVGETDIVLPPGDDREPAYWSGGRAHPGILRIGGLRAAGALAAPGKLRLQISGGFDVAPVQAAYRAQGAEGRLHLR